MLAEGQWKMTRLKKQECVIHSKTVVYSRWIQAKASLFFVEAYKAGHHFL